METKIDFIRGLFYGIIVIVLLVVSLLAIFVVSVYTTSLVDSQRMPESTGTGNETSQY